MDLKARKRWTLVLLLVWLPIYVVLAVTFMNWLDARFGRMPIWAEVPVYAVLAFLWAIPFRRVFRGVGRGEE
ncbi:MAG TPA: DUF2842 domain-containing protein [Paracoccus sp. (in: a-proteobacteria)]|nr:DUF2842 domain-containing protein [Paracoccus sp. (in: a-proteobacteria)]